jgi:hypothetical protein
MGSESPGNEAAKEALNEKLTTGLDSMDQRKTRTRTTRKMGKLDHNHERGQTTPHKEHKHQNDDQTREDCHKPQPHWIYPEPPILQW